MKKLITLLLVLGMFVLSGCTGTAPSPENPEGDDSTKEPQEQLLFEDDNVKVSFIEIFEEPSITGAAYLRLKVENKTDKTVTVYPQDAYVNDTSIILASGVSMKLAPGKNSQTPFIIFYTNLGITSKDEINKIEFKLTFDDENYDMIAETDIMVIDLSK